MGFFFSLIVLFVLFSFAAGLVVVVVVVVVSRSRIIREGKLIKSGLYIYVRSRLLQCNNWHWSTVSF